MIPIVLTNIWRFVLLVALQVLILNYVEVSGFLNPFLYVLFLLLLPFELPRTWLLALAFLLGITVDIFSNTLGMHLAASLLMAYCRPYVLAIIAPRGGYEVGTTPSIRDMGLPWFLSYAGALIFLHHLMLFFVEVFRFTEVFLTLGRVLASSVFTLLLVLLAQYLTYRPKLSE